MQLQEIILPQLLQESAAKYSDRPAIEYKQKYYSLTEIDNLSSILAKKFESMGISANDHIGLFGPNSVDWVITYISLSKIGAVPVLINNNFTLRELKQAIKISKLTKLFYGDTALTKIIEDPEGKLLSRYPDLVGNTHEMAYDHADLMDNATKNADGNIEFYCSSKATPYDTCCLIFTSGSTRSPKAAEVTHISLVNNSADMANVMKSDTEDSICMSLPLFHIYGFCGCFLACLISGTTIHMIENIKSTDIMACVEENKCTILNGVPTSYLALINNDEFAKYDMSSIRLGVLGGAAVTIPQMKRIMETGNKIT